MSDSDVQFAALKVQLESGRRLAKQGSCRRRMPNREALPKLRAALAGLRSLSSQQTSAEFWRTLAFAEELLLHYPAAVAALEKAISLTPQPERKDLKRLAQLKECAQMWAELQLEPELLAELGRFLRVKLESEACDHSKRHTEAWLTQRGVLAPEKVIEAIESNGGFCDCEVLANVV